MAENIIGNQDGPNGENRTFRIPGRGTQIPLEKVVQEIKDGRHPGFHIYTLNGQEHPRANPDGTTADNINR